jgi:hypothetical protein
MTQLRKVAKWTLAVAGILAGCLVLGGLMGWFAQSLINLNSRTIIRPLEPSTQPYLHKEASDAPVTTFRAGEAMLFHIDGIRRAACSQLVSYRLFFIEDDKRVLYVNYPLNVGYSVAGTYSSDVYLPLPNYLPLGHYKLERFAIYRCNEAVIEQTMQPLDLEIVR